MVDSRWEVDIFYKGLIEKYIHKKRRCTNNSIRNLCPVSPRNLYPIHRLQMTSHWWLEPQGWPRSLRVRVAMSNPRLLWPLPWWSRIPLWVKQLTQWWHLASPWVWSPQGAMVPLVATPRWGLGAWTMLTPATSITPITREAGRIDVLNTVH